jgi:hypothetical protein
MRVAVVNRSYQTAQQAIAVTSETVCSKGGVELLWGRGQRREEG